MHPDCTVDQCCRHCGNSQSLDNFPNTIDMPESLWKVAQSPASTCSILCQSLVNSRQAPLQLSQKGSSDFLDKISKSYQTHQDFCNKLSESLRFGFKICKISLDRLEKVHLVPQSFASTIPKRNETPRLEPKFSGAF